MDCFGDSPMIKKAEPPEFTSVAMKIPRDKETNRKPNKNKEHEITALGE